MAEATPTRWVDTSRSPGRARLTSLVRHPGQWAKARTSRRRGNSEIHDVPATRDEVLARLVELPISTWTYGWEHDSVKHLGPMAQDFAKAFGLGDTDRAIANVDAQGVAMAAIQALHERVAALEAQLAARDASGD